MKEKFSKDPSTNYKIHNNSKHTYDGYCVQCLEKSRFRHCLVNGMNAIVCVICMTAKPLLKGIDFPDYMIIKKLHWTHEVHRFFIRLMNIKRTWKILKPRKNKKIKKKYNILKG